MACGNVKQIYGMTFEEQPILKRKMLLFLHDMVQNGTLGVEEERLKLCDNNKHMLDIVRTSE